MDTSLLCIQRNIPGVGRYSGPPKVRNGPGSHTSCTQGVLSPALLCSGLFGLKTLCADSLPEAPHPTPHPCALFTKWRFCVFTKSKLFLKTWGSLLTICPEQLSHSHWRYPSPLHSCLVRQGQSFNFGTISSFEVCIMENFSI